MGNRYLLCFQRNPRLSPPLPESAAAAVNSGRVLRRSASAKFSKCLLRHLWKSGRIVLKGRPVSLVGTHGRSLPCVWALFSRFKRVRSRRLPPHGDGSLLFYVCVYIIKKRTQLFLSRGQHAHISQRGPGGTQPPGPLLVPGSGQERGLFSAGLRLSGEFSGNRLSRAVLQKFFRKP